MSKVFLVLYKFFFGGIRITIINKRGYRYLFGQICPILLLSPWADGITFCVLTKVCEIFLVQVPVGHPTEVDEIFDNISYNKGASVIRMLYNWIGSENFKRGMSKYLTKYSYKVGYSPDPPDPYNFPGSGSVSRVGLDPNPYGIK